MLSLENKWPWIATTTRSVNKKKVLSTQETETHPLQNHYPEIYGNHFLVFCGVLLPMRQSSNLSIISKRPQAKAASTL